MAEVAELVDRAVALPPGPELSAVLAGERFEWAAHEIAAGLTWTPATADRELGFATALCERLPLVFASLQQGRIDRGKARIFVEYLDPANGDLTEEQSRRLCKKFVPQAPGWTTKQLGDRLYRALHAIDPDLRAGPSSYTSPSRNSAATAPTRSSATGTGCWPRSPTPGPPATSSAAGYHPDKDRGWSLSQPAPGLFRWVSPLGRMYWTLGEPVRPDLPDPDPADHPDEETATEADRRLRRHDPRILDRPATDPPRPPPPKPEQPPPVDQPPPF